MSSTLVRVLFVCVGFLYVWGFTMRVFLSRVVEREIQRSVSSFRAVCADLLSFFLSLFLFSRDALADLSSANFFFFFLLARLGGIGGPAESVLVILRVRRV